MASLYTKVNGVGKEITSSLFQKQNVTEINYCGCTIGDLLLITDETVHSMIESFIMSIILMRRIEMVTSIKRLD